MFLRCVISPSNITSFVSTASTAEYLFLESSAPCGIEIIVKTGLALWVEESEVCAWGVILGSSGSFPLITGDILSFKFYFCGSRPVEVRLILGEKAR